MGDPAGIGPEVALKAVRKLDNENIIPVIIGRGDILKTFYPQYLKDYRNFNNNPDIIKGEKYLCDVPLNFPVPVLGTGTPDTGRESLEYINLSIKLLKEEKINAVVTSPVSKGFIEKSGVPFTGHTEYIAEMLGEQNPLMMMYSENYRVLLVTTHIPVSEIPSSIDGDRIRNIIIAGAASISKLDGKKPRIAVAGLDPHCGDNGAISRFDRDVTARAVSDVRNLGIDVEGPFSADTLFIRENWNQYDLVVAQYHDQGLIPFKMLAFDNGVNVTLGLSITRTSVDHGTAYDIAGKDTASYTSMMEAIRLAYRLEIFRSE